MIDLFGAEGRAALTRLAARRTLYAFDFDGTLAPIVADPAAARAGPATLSALEALVALVPVAVLTGRGVADLRARVGFEPAYVVGNHGAEGMPEGIDHGHGLSEAGQMVAAWLAQWPAASRHAPMTGVVIEKKTHSLSIHYRHADDPEAARRAIESAIARLSPPPRVIGGKCVFNLLPEGAPDKGSALLALVAHTGSEAAFFIGDDLTDEAAFAVAPDDWVTVHVGGDGDSRARYFVESQEAVDACVALLVASVRDVNRHRDGS